jgi:hypothetical protein
MADTTALWVNSLFDESVSGPWTDGTIAISPIVNNLNNAYNSLDITIKYEFYDPDGEFVQVGSLITAVVEERLFGDLWIPIAQQGRETKGSDNARNHIIRIKPVTIVDSSPIAITEGPRVVTWISNAEGSLGGETRVRLVRVITDNSKPLHTKIQVTAYAREYDTQ